MERLIGLVRGECLDHVIVLGESHLHRITKSYATYYNETQAHLSRGKDAPAGRSIEQSCEITPLPILGGSHHRYCRIQFVAGTGLYHRYC